MIRFLMKLKKNLLISSIETFSVVDCPQKGFFFFLVSFWENVVNVFIYFINYSSYNQSLHHQYLSFFFFPPLLKFFFVGLGVLCFLLYQMQLVTLQRNHKTQSTPSIPVQ